MNCLSLILRNWGDTEFGILLDGQELGPGKEPRFSYERTLRGTDLVIWLEKTSTEPVTVTLTRVKGAKGSNLR